MTTNLIQDMKRMMKPKGNALIPLLLKDTDKALLERVKSLIEAAKHEAAVTVNSAMTLLYWEIGAFVNSYIQRLFLWMDVDSRALLYGLDHVQHICNKINELKPI